MSWLIYGYIRVSTPEQNEERQIEALKSFGVEEKNIFTDKISGKNFNRTAYQKLLKKIKPGDTLVVKSIDRLGRNYFEIPQQWKIITQDKGANIVVLDMPILDTRRHQDLLGNFISDLVLQILSYVAQTERDFMRERQAEGIRIAKNKGVKFGRKPKERTPIFFELKDRWKRGEISARKAAKTLQIDPKTFLRWSREKVAEE